jgi:hypothetical protein
MILVLLAIIVCVSVMFAGRKALRWLDREGDRHGPDTHAPRRTVEEDRKPIDGKTKDGVDES